MSNAQVRNVVMFAVLAVWMIFAGSALIRHDELPPWTWGIPASVFGALYGPNMFRKSDVPPPEAPQKVASRKRKQPPAAGPAGSEAE